MFVLKNCSVIVCVDKIIENFDILVEKNEIKKIAKTIDIPNIKNFDLSGCIVFPGFINTHHHLYQILTRCLKKVANKPLFEWLTTLYNYWAKITPEDIYWGSLGALCELILSGCTTTTDMFYIFPQSQPKDLIDYEIKSAKDLGMRFVPARGGMSLGKSKGGLPPDEIVQDEEEIFKDYERLVKKYHNTEKFSMLQIALGPCSPFSVSKELMKETANFAKKNLLLLHTHLAETIDEENFCLEKYKMRPLEYMEEVGWLNENVWFAHCIHLNEKEIKKIGERKIGVSHCPVSNLRLGSGIASIKQMLDSGCKVGVAVDGSSSNDSGNFVAEMRTCLLIHRIKNPVSTFDVIKMATINAADILHRDDIGSIEVGKSADIVAFDIDNIFYSGAMHNLVDAFLLCSSPLRAKFVWIDGKIIVENGKIVTIDEKKVVNEVNKRAKRIISKG